MDCDPRIANLLPQLASDRVDVDGVVSQEDSLILVDRDHQPFFGNLLHRPGFWHADVNPRLQHWRGHHENDQQHQHDVHERGDVNVGEGGLRSSA